MSVDSSNIIEFPRNSTMAEIAVQLAKLNTTQEAIAKKEGAIVPSADWAQIKEIVSLKNAQRNFEIGDQIIDSWKDTVTGTSYDLPWDIVDFGDITNKSGEIKPAMWIQWHYLDLYGVQFDAAEDILYTETGIPTGTYYFTFSGSWGNITDSKSYQFTLTSSIPAGGQICFYKIGWPDDAVANWKVSTYSGPTSTTIIETAPLTEGTSGTNLGTLNNSKKNAGTFTVSGTTYTYELNGYYMAGYGYNRWSKSAKRQYLNSADAIGAWWTPQHVHDRPPAELATKPGFLSGFSDDFIEHLEAVKVVTALNSYDSTAEGITYDETYDKIFIPSLQQMYINPQISGEGDAWEYYKQLNGTSTLYAQYGTYPALKRYRIDAKTSSECERLRSASRGNGSNTWYVNPSGNVSTATSLPTRSASPRLVQSIKSILNPASPRRGGRKVKNVSTQLHAEKRQIRLHH